MENDEYGRMGLCSPHAVATIFIFGICSTSEHVVKTMGPRFNSRLILPRMEIVYKPLRVLACRAYNNVNQCFD